MNKLISIIGVSGVGKTTLTQALCKRKNFAVALESHDARPFQTLFKNDSKYAFVNQMDYLLFRAEQEQELRSYNPPAIMDGGLDLDFYGFTKLFHKKGLLTDSEFDLCRRFHALTRSLLPPPDLIIALSADSETVRQRLAARNRINIASSEDAQTVEEFINEWISSLPESKILRLDVASENMDYAHSIPIILDKINP